MENLTPFNCSIGIVTYLGRFETYFKPLIRKLHFLFPDYDIIVFINGHYDTVKQIQYLKDVTYFLRKYPNIRYVTNLEHQALARGWNWLVFMAKNDRILILNDDVSFNWEFRHNLESLPSVPDIFTLNGSWSHFVISKDIIREVGWFDERFYGTGDEDYDYKFRLAMSEINLIDIIINGLHNFVAPIGDAGWANVSNVIHEKYSEINRDFLKKKWLISNHKNKVDKTLSIYCYPEEWEIGLNPELEITPEYYPLRCLEVQNGKFIKFSFNIFLAKNFAKIMSLSNTFYWTSRRFLGAWVRKLFGNQWDNFRKRIFP